jgi:hypothetical protein
MVDYLLVSKFVTLRHHIIYHAVQLLIHLSVDSAVSHKLIVLLVTFSNLLPFIQTHRLLKALSSGGVKRFQDSMLSLFVLNLLSDNSATASWEKSFLKVEKGSVISFY